jgi:hypothetical protein
MKTPAIALNGKKGFPDHDSDFVVLEEDGV